MRKYQRAVAKARMKAMGIERVNRRMSRKVENGKTLWREILWGAYAAEARRAQVKPKRTIRRISPITG